MAVSSCRQLKQLGGGGCHVKVGGGGGCHAKVGWAKVGGGGGAKVGGEGAGAP